MNGREPQLRTEVDAGALGRPLGLKKRSGSRCRVFSRLFKVSASVQEQVQSDCRTKGAD